MNGRGERGITFYLGSGGGPTGFKFDETTSCSFDNNIRGCSFPLGIYGTVSSHCVNIHLETICLGHLPLSFRSLCKVYKKIYCTWQFHVRNDCICTSYRKVCRDCICCCFALFCFIEDTQRVTIIWVILSAVEQSP